MLKNLFPKFTQLLSQAQASGRWYPQPTSFRSCSQCPNQKNLHLVSPTAEELKLPRENAFPIYAKSRGTEGTVYKLKKGKRGELLADYNLFVDAIKMCEVRWNSYDGMTSAEKDVYMAHYTAVQNRKLVYIDPLDKTTHKTVIALLFDRNCCGEGCRHCPYELKNFMNCRYIGLGRQIPEYIGELDVLLLITLRLEKKRIAVADWLTVFMFIKKVIGRNICHMQHWGIRAQILVAIKGEMKKAYVVGANTHVNYRKHGIPSTDTNNIVLMDDEGNPIGNRVLAPIPGNLLKKRDNIEMAKIVSLATKFI